MSFILFASFCAQKNKLTTLSYYASWKQLPEEIKYQFSQNVRANQMQNICMLKCTFSREAGKSKLQNLLLLRCDGY